MNGEDSFFAANDDDFVWPVCSSGESDDDVIEVIMCSVPSSPETNADAKIEENEEVTANLAGNELNSKSKSASNDESVKEDEVIDGIRGEFAANSQVEECNEIRANLAGNKQNQKEEQIRVTESSNSKVEESTRPNAAMNCLIEMLKQMYEIDDEKTNQDDIDFAETAKRRGITFPKPRGFDS